MVSAANPNDCSDHSRWSSCVTPAYESDTLGICSTSSPPSNNNFEVLFTMHIPVEALSFETILNTTMRLPFTRLDATQLTTHLENVRKHGLDLEIDLTYSTGGLHEMLDEGYLCIQSRDLGTDMIFVHVDAGKGFFGRQKSRVSTFTSDIYRGQYYAGPVLGSLLRAMVGINNLHRAAGLLRGSAT